MDNDRIATCVLEAFEALPAKCKPVEATAGIFQWVPLSGIAIMKGNNEARCVALGTGMKCLPAKDISNAKGAILHDFHAEIVAIRAFNHFLLQESLKLAKAPSFNSPFLRRRLDQELSASNGFQPFSLHSDLKICMFNSEAPCGDASMELVMEAQKDATPWPVADSNGNNLSAPALLKGRGSFSELGIVRRKPARADSPLTLSKSCSDKLALKQCTSLLSSLTSLLISPEHGYLDTLVLPRSQHNHTACTRAFRPEGRMKSVFNCKWASAYRFHPFSVQNTEQEFAYSRRMWHPNLLERLILGRLQGRKAQDPKAASQISNVRMWELVRQLVIALNSPLRLEISRCKSYRQLKISPLFDERKQVKHDARAEALKGWVRNEDVDFDLSFK
ncbi:MAG: hypothetical protein Q9214_002106 [Letrouitia sp. 1 TL-2023]